jgi:hypothetical protein
LEEGFDVETERVPVHEGLDCLVVVHFPDLPEVNGGMCGTDDGLRISNKEYPISNAGDRGTGDRGDRQAIQMF